MNTSINSWSPPYLSSNANKKYNFHIVIILDPTDDTDEYLSSIDIEYAAMLNAYSDNEYIFQTYLNFYSDYFKNIKTIISNYDNVTYDEFKEAVFSDFRVSIDNKWYITMETIPMIDSMLVTNEFIYDDMSSIDNDYNTMYNVFIQSFVESLTLFNLLNDKIFIKNCPNLMKLLLKIYKVYIPLLILIDNYGDEDALDDIPGDYKMELTKIADFPAPLEEITYFDIVNEPYILLYLLKNSGYYSGVPEDG